MNILDINLWLLVMYKNKYVEIMNHSYEYEYSKENLTQLLLGKYKYYPLNLLLDNRYKNDFRLIKSTEDFNEIDYKTLDCGVNYIKLNNKLIYKGDSINEVNK